MEQENTDRNVYCEAFITQVCHISDTMTIMLLSLVCYKPFVNTCVYAYARVINRVTMDTDL